MNITAAHAYTNYDLCAEAMGRELMGLAPDPAVAPAPRTTLSSFMKLMQYFRSFGYDLQVANHIDTQIS